MTTVCEIRIQKNQFFSFILIVFLLLFIPRVTIMSAWKNSQFSLNGVTQFVEKPYFSFFHLELTYIIAKPANATSFQIEEMKHYYSSSRISPINRTKIFREFLWWNWTAILESSFIFVKTSNRDKFLLNMWVLWEPWV